MQDTAAHRSSGPEAEGLAMQHPLAALRIDRQHSTGRVPLGTQDDAQQPEHGLEQGREGAGSADVCFSR